MKPDNKKSTALAVAITLIVGLLFFFATISITFAQTRALRPGDEGVGDTEETTPPPPPAGTSLNGTPNIDVRKDDHIDAEKVEKEAEAIRGKNAPGVTRTFLEKAKQVLEERRLGENNDNANRHSTTTREDVLQKKKDRISGFLSDMQRKTDAAISRLSKISDRIESRTSKFQEMGADTTEATRLLGIAKGDIQDAKDALSTALEKAREAFSVDLSRDSFGNVVSEFSHAKEYLRKAHQALVEVIRSLKAIPVDQGTNPSDTNTETSN